ncbi:MAG: hypothetical protein LBQ02_03295 [Candidatus Nomurabacteria bacterium]|jgi:hypothetical protein|nr:hypothetical protein [Candidatus Nomurabacteria bacterium]
MRNKLLQKAESAIKNAEFYFLSLKNDIAQARHHQQNTPAAEYFGADPVAYADFLYKNPNFKKYIFWMIVAQKLDRAMTRRFALIWCGWFLFILLCVALAPLDRTGTIAMYIIVIGFVSFFGTVICSAVFCTDTEYRSFLAKTFLRDLIFGAVPEFSTTFPEHTTIPSHEVCEHTGVTDVGNVLATGVMKWRLWPLTLRTRFFGKKKHDTANLVDTAIKRTVTDSRYSTKTRHETVFMGPLSAGRFADLSLELKNKGKKAFVGLYYDIFGRKLFQNLRGNAILIRANETLVASATEATIHAIHDNKYNHHFVDETLNKVLDCRISGFKGFSNLEEMHFEATRIMTAAFEERLLFLYKRYNAFNLTFTDKGLNFNVSPRRSAYAKIKRGEFMDFKKTYAEAVVDSTVPKASDKDFFRYYRVFPLIEKVYLCKYLTDFWYAYMAPQDYHALSKQLVSGYEPKLLAIETMKWKEFKQIFDTELDAIYNKAKALKEVTRDGIG